MPQLSLKSTFFICSLATVVVLVLALGPDDTNNNDRLSSDHFTEDNGNAVQNVPVERIEAVGESGERSPEYVDSLGTRSGFVKYAGVAECGVCHGDLVTSWRGTGHGKDFTPNGTFPSVNYGRFFLCSVRFLKSSVSAISSPRSL